MNSFHSVIYKLFSDCCSPFGKCWQLSGQDVGFDQVINDQIIFAYKKQMKGLSKWSHGYYWSLAFVAMFILHNQSYAQIYHSWLLVRVIGKIDIVLEANTYPLMLYCSVLLLRLLDICWLLCRPDRDVRTDSAMNHSVSMYLEQQGREL